MSGWMKVSDMLLRKLFIIRGFHKPLEVHLMIVAGRVRKELQNYRLLTHYVGSGEVRKNFGHRIS
jgi:hypothetical protein